MTDIETRIEELVKNAIKSNIAGDNSNWPFLDIDDYQKKTGKRFRMTRAQKELGITREQAFKEFMDKMITK